MSPTEGFLATSLAAVAATYLIAEGLKDHLDDRGEHDHICCGCGHIGLPVTKLQGRLSTELFLWTLFVFPGYAYSVWRINTRHPRCGACGSAKAVRAGSTSGRRKARASRVMNEKDDLAGWDRCEAVWHSGKTDGYLP